MFLSPSVYDELSGFKLFVSCRFVSYLVGIYLAVFSLSFFFISVHFATLKPRQSFQNGTMNRDKKIV